MNGWQMSVPNYKDGNAQILNDRRPTDHDFFAVGATFATPPDEHFYGLGQNQEGYLDRRGHVVRCAHDYNAPSGQSVCVPFVVTNKGYGLLWDNPSRTTVSFGFNDQTNWLSDVGQRVSFFVIAGNTYDEIYSGYRLLTGDTPIPPRSAFGYIQCKQRYTSQEELLAVAHGYRERHLPIDDLVIDWFHYTKMGEMDMDPAKWPDPTAMNKELHRLNFHTMISVWPRFVPESRYYATVLKNNWFEHLADGTPTNGLPYDRAGADIDSTDPDARKWYWSIIKENYIARALTPSGPTRPSPTCPPTAPSGRSAPAPSTSTSSRSSTPPPSTTACAPTRTSAPSSSPATPISAHSTTAPSSGPPTSPATGIPSSARSPPASTSSPPERPTGPPTSAAGSTFPPSTNPPSAPARPLRRARQRRRLRRLPRALHPLVRVRRLPAQLPLARLPQTK